MKIKTEGIKSIKLIVPIDGTIEVDANGIADVSEECARIMVENTSSWSYVEDVKEAAPAEKNESDDDRAEFEKKIRIMKFDDLKKFAIESGCDEEMVNSITSKKNMVNYLLEQFDKE